MTEKLPISLIAIVRNANGRVKKLIDAHKDVVSETIIVDQNSTDGTYEEALANADQVYRRRCKGTADPDRNWAFSLANQPFVLYLDDDEALTDEAKAALPELVKSGGDVFWFKRQNFVDGMDIREVLGDDPQCRLFRRGAVKFPDEIHQYPQAANNTKIFFLDCAIKHDRTMDQILSANRSRNSIATEKDKANQERFIKAVKNLISEKDGFTENWYSSSQLASLQAAYAKAKPLEGEVIEIGCWEGKSTVSLAQAAYPETITAVDTWQGNIAEGEDHASVVAAKKRDVYGTFLQNMKNRTQGNFKAVKNDCFKFLSRFKGQIKFCHIDAAHDYVSVKKTIDMLKPFLVKGAVLCGDDFMSANAKRVDLQGGVERAVVESCPGFVSQENFWYWINK